MSTHQVIGYTPEIGKALKRIMAETPQTDTGKLAYPNGKKQSTINTKAKASSGKFEYNGYFKIIDASEMDEGGKITAYKVKVVDGARPDIMSTNMYCKVNNRSVYVPSIVSTALDTSKYYIVAIKCVIGKTFNIKGEIVLLDNVNTLPSDTVDTLYYEIGSLYFTKQAETDFHILNIVQRFPDAAVLRSAYSLNGVPQLIWFMERCYDIV